MAKLDYKKIYDKYHDSPLAKARRAARGRARYAVMKRLGKDAIEGKEVDHKNTNPGGNLSNSPKNLQVIDRSKNRSKDANSWRKTKKRNH